ncbi:MAG: PulJ/GspJ family protein, partial [Planctomycetota bacterium]
MSRRAGGFTLVELMVAMSLFLVLGTALVALLTNAFDFLRAGTAGSEVADKGADFLRPFTMDLENVLTERGLDPGPSSIRFHSDFVPVPEKIGTDKEVDFLAQRLVFVRSTTSEAADPLGRQAGMKSGADAYIDGKDDLAEAKDGKLRAPGGMQEISYMTLAGSEPGVLSLYRAARSP